MSKLGASGLQKLNSGDNVGGRGVTIHVNTAITAWDASDIERNQKHIIGIIGQSIRNNGEIRALIRNYA
jgi:hypothetical protein